MPLCSWETLYIVARSRHVWAQGESDHRVSRAWQAVQKSRGGLDPRSRERLGRLCAGRLELQFGPSSGGITPWLSVSAGRAASW